MQQAIGQFLKFIPMHTLHHSNFTRKQALDVNDGVCFVAMKSWGIKVGNSIHGSWYCLLSTCLMQPYDVFSDCQRATTASIITILIVTVDGCLQYDEPCKL
jgi:uncharacterized membrane protein (DUF2068 family)